MNRRIICIVLSALMILVLTGCMGSRPAPMPLIEMQNNDVIEEAKVPDNAENVNVSFTATPFYQGDTGTINNNSGSQNNDVGNGSSGKNELCSGQTDIGYTIDDFKGAFQNCTQLTSVIIPDGITDILDNAFYDCTGLTTVIVPASVKVIWNCAFSGCTSLEAIYFEGDAPQFANYVLESTEPVPYYHEGASGWTNPFYGCVTTVY